MKDIGPERREMYPYLSPGSTNAINTFLSRRHNHAIECSQGTNLVTKITANKLEN